MNRSDAYTALLMRHRTMLWRMCRVHALGDRARCCDFLQEVSIALWLNFDKLRPDATPHQERAWVRWQARSVFDHIKRRHQLPTEPITDALSDNLSDEDPLCRMELLDDLLSALEPDEQRMMQLYLKGYHADEIGKHMGLSRNAVYQRMHRAVQKMRRVVMILFLLLLTSAVAVAVVPQWRHFVFGSSKPEETVIDTTPVQPQKEPPVEVPPTDTVVCMVGSVVHPVRETLQHMSPMVVPDIPVEMQPLPDPGKVTVKVDGNILTVSGAKDEMVRVYDMHGNLLASQLCDGFCVISLFSSTDCLACERSYYQLRIGSRPALLLKL